jgi:hypothetical protein
MSPAVTDRPIYWLVLLEQARERRDPRAAAQARRELARLGVRVTYRRGPQRPQGVRRAE